MATFRVTNPADSGSGTLREAIEILAISVTRLSWLCHPRLP
ncbi:hypothetical protein [Bacillus sp. X1(2014)]|nr:hypothetical protein [Bacillus sp. X1(2014)]